MNTTNTSSTCEPTSKSELILSHRSFAQNLARQLFRYASSAGVEYEDLEGAAMVGLCDAASRFRSGQGASFRSFAYLRIRGAAYDLLRREGRVPRAVCRRNGDPRHGGAEASVKGAETVESLGIRLHVSGEGTDLSYLDAQSPEAAAEFAAAARTLARSVAALPEPERTLIQLHYYQGTSFGELCRTFGDASKSWVSRLHRRALKQLHALVADELFPSAGAPRL